MADGALTLPSRDLRLCRLWLAAIDAWTSLGVANAAPLCPARDAMRAALDRDAHRAHVVVTGAEQRRCMAWLRALAAAVEAIDAEGGSGGVALAWAAVSAWGDVRVAPWTRLETALARLAAHLDAADTSALRAGTKLREHMERVSDVVWPVMKEGVQ